MKDRVTVGRAPDNDVPLPDDSTVSAHHALLSWSNGAWFVEDMQSKNGIWIEVGGIGHRVAGKVRIDVGATLSVGRTRLALNTTAQPEAETVSFDDTPALERRPAVLLQVALEDNRIRVQMSSSRAYGTRYTAPYRGEDVQQTLDECARLMASANLDRGESEGGQGAFSAKLRHIGTYLFEHMLPRRIQERLIEEDADDLLLLHDPALLAVPWELAYTGNEFFCLRWNLARQVALDEYSAYLKPRRRRRPPRLLIVANPTETLPEVQEQAEALFESLQNYRDTADAVYLSGRRVERLDLLRRIEESDLVYFVGHAEHDAENPENSAWLLANGRVTCGDFRQLRTPPALVFANGCETSHEADWPADLPVQHRACGLASGFILAGIENYLGAVWPVAARAGLTFARAFFTHLLLAAPIAKATRLARRAVIEDHGEAEPAWAAYTLYGNPTRTLTCS